MAKIIIDGKTYEVDSSKNLLETILSLKLNLQYFCWHPAMGSVGACRQCAVKKYRDENDKAGKLFMACMEPVVDGMRVSIEDPEAKEFRAGVIEWLMTNHPHDCPVCDEGGECHLQDMTLMSGHNYRRFRYKKRTYRNQYLGPFLHHEMNRCIQCYRCVRFYRDYAGGDDLNVFGVHSSVYFGRHEDGVLENEFAGNLVEVCPTGVFTDNTLFQHYTRKWDLTSAPSVCVHCGVGCNTLAGERYGKLRRILTRYNGQVNGYFLCDRGRFGYEFVNSEKRIRKPMLRLSGENRLSEADEETAITEISAIIKSSRKVMGIGSPRASLEANFTLRSLVSERNFYWGVPEQEFSLLTKEMNILRQGSIRTPSLREIEKCDVVVILGEDLTNTAPMIALAVRQSVRQVPVQSATPYKIPHWQDAAVRELVQDEKGPVFVATPYATKLDSVARTFRGSADEIARLGYAIAGAISSDAPKADNLNEEVCVLSESISKALNKAERPLIIAGQSLKSEAIVNAAANIAYAMRKAGKNVELCYTVPECNSMGMVMMGGKALDQAFHAVEKEAMDTLIIMENDLFRRDEKQAVDRFLKRFKNIIVLDYIENATTERATAIIPVGSFAESDGTFVNNEGRAQRFYQVFVPNKEIKESWRWVRNIMVTSGMKEFSRWKNLLDYTQALIKEMPYFTGIDTITPPPGFRIAGRKIPREPYRYSGRTAMHADKTVHEPKPPEDVDSPMSFTMEGYRGQPPSSLIPFFWSPGWNSAQAINKYQIEVGGPLHGGDPGKRLIEPLPNAKPSYFTDVPKAFAPREGEWMLVPVYHIFGSDELSVHSPGVRELVPKPYIMLSPDDAARLQVTSDSELELGIGGQVERLPVKINLGLRPGLAGYPVTLPGMSVVRFPVSVKISGVKK
ncbi:MAG: NADH-quinone oxidoreductase subunit NuoG [Ignavibacteria bacterium]|nr:NADH-quinone oxidoreductase subunit NuoG [Ignavibacteria bacterium]MCU7503423.1 NADH-quinone oxidoreductase subunit NuoG [Ignavibacteria bacterium]MCU7516245.1 NADH-quinone oxidoreductase subunit NuoG [Ignavibacteria bacterium]